MYSGGEGLINGFLGVFICLGFFFFSFTCNTQTEVNLTEVCAGMTSVAATRVGEVKDEEGFEGLVFLLNPAEFVRRGHNSCPVVSGHVACVIQGSEHVTAHFDL